jgi:F-type H+-transporting ATPase subunit a
MPEQLWFTEILNRYFGGAANSLLNAVHQPAAYPNAPINNFVAMEILVVGILFVFFVLVRSQLSVESPGGLQHMMEGVYGFIDNQSHEIIEHDYKRFTPYLVALGLFILLGNLIGLIPGFVSPTATPTVPLGFAVCTFLYYHFHGLRKHKHHYIKQFLGPVWVMAPLMFVIEVVSHFARVLSLTVRLYANIFAGDMVTLAFFSLVPIGVPIIFLLLHLGVSLVQTFIFVVLATVYLAGAVGDEH